MSAASSASSVTLPPAFQRTLDRAVTFLTNNLGENLHSLMLYGSAVRGNVTARGSDLNLLIVLEASVADAHEVISEITAGPGPINPMVIERRALQRAKRVFALKFLSIRRDYRVLHGADPLADLEVTSDLLVLLCEQELRNLRMRVVRAYVMAGAKSAVYMQFLTRNIARIFIVLSDTARCAEVDIPHDLDKRLPVFAETFQADVAVLETLLQHKRQPMRMSRAQVHDLHARLLNLFQHSIDWIERRWPTPPL